MFVCVVVVIKVRVERVSEEGMGEVHCQHTHPARHIECCASTLAQGAGSLFQSRGGENHDLQYSLRRCFCRYSANPRLQWLGGG